MDKAARMRWAILLVMLAVTVGAIFYPADEQSAMRPRRVPPAPAGAALPASAAQEAPQQAQADAVDPFAPRGWKPPAPVAAPAVVALVAVAAAAPPPEVAPGPPPLPFQFMGRMNDGASQTVYLSRGEETLIARSGEALDATYKVLSIAPRRIDFEYTPTGDKQSLNLPAPEN